MPDCVEGRVASDGGVWGSSPGGRFTSLTDHHQESRQPSPSVSLDGDLAAVEQWFVARGLPHFVERRLTPWQIWSRAIPLLALYYVAASLSALDLARWSWLRNLLVGVVSLIAVIIVWMIANVARGHRWNSMPRHAGPAELAALIVVPILPAALLGQWSDVAETLLLSVVVLAGVWFAASYGAVQLLRWAFVVTRSQFGDFGNMLLRALPLLLMFTTFLFINAEVWQVAGRLVGLPYWLVLTTFFALGAAFLLTRTPPIVRRLNEFGSAADVLEQLHSGTAVPAPARQLAAALLVDPGTAVSEPLRRRQRFNGALVAVFPQALQITAAAVAITVFFVGFGFVAISLDTVAAWTGTTPGAVNELLALHLRGQRLTLNEPLLRVAGFLGAFTGMYFTVVSVTDSTYREEFRADVAPALRTAMAVRVPYRLAVGASRKSR